MEEKNLLKEAIGVAATIDEARAMAIAELGADELADVKIEVIELPVKKTLGLFGGSPAKVRAYIETSPKDAALDYLKDVIAAMGIENANVTAQEVEGGLSVTVECDDNSILIGRHGDTLDALQYLAGLVANKDNDDDYYRVSINTGNYREKREKSLVGYARKTAIQVTKTGKSITLEPMNPYERRIIHTAVQGIRGAQSYSTGEGNDRKVVICLEEGFKPTGGNRDRNRRGGYNNRGKGGHNRGRSGGKYDRYDRKAGTENAENAEGAEAESFREPKSDLKSAPLYGKIESFGSEE